MILILADDLSGAAELAGEAVSLGLTASVQTRLHPESRCDVLALDTDSRHLPAGEAARKVAAMARDALQLQPAWIYKKTDSVLRGNVRAEIEAIAEATGRKRVAFIPANPSRRRVIRAGTYYVEGVPLAETAFAQDPDHPRRSSSVVELLGGALDARWQVPDVASAEDIARTVAEAGDDTLPAGGVDFFGALLRARCGGAPAKAAPSPALQGPVLFVCGSAAAWNQGRLAQCRQRGVMASVMPAELFRDVESGAAREAWAEGITRTLAERGGALAAIGVSPVGVIPGSARLAECLAEVVVQVCRRTPVATLLVEGGATASAVLRQGGWTCLDALQPLAPGLATLRPAGVERPQFLIKPGSYPWPEVVWDAVGREGRF